MADHSMNLDAEACRRFQSALWDRQSEPMERFVPSENDSNYLATLEELVHIDLEFQWKLLAQEIDDGGMQTRVAPRVENYLARFPRLQEASIVRRLLEQEYRVRHRYGDRPAGHEFRERFPEHVTESDAMGGLTLETNADHPAQSGQGPPSDQDIGVLLAPPQAPDELGRLGPYRVLKVLGAGGMGLVFQAEDTKLRRQIALKVILPRFASDARARQRFEREARAAAALEHDHIIAIYQVGEERGVPFVAMPLLRGESLHTRIRREQRLPMADVLRIGREIAEGLSAAHDHGLIHRDIKPGNIFLEYKHQSRALQEATSPTLLSDSSDSLGRVKILDFGLARAAAMEQGDEPLTGTGEAVGTPAYMAPEQARGDDVDARCDLFSLGCVLYEMSTGELPFKGKNAFAIVASLASDQFTPPRHLNAELPAQLDDLIVRLLAKGPDDRPRSAHEVVATLAALEDKTPVTEDPWQDQSTCHVRLAPKHTRSKKFYVLGSITAGLLVAALALGTGGWYIGRGPDAKSLPVLAKGEPIPEPGGLFLAPEFQWDFANGYPPEVTEEKTQIVQAKEFGPPPEKGGGIYKGGPHLRFTNPTESWLEVAFEVPEAVLTTVRKQSGRWRLDVYQHSTTSTLGQFAPIRIALNGHQAWEGSPDGSEVFLVPGGVPWKVLDRDVSLWVKAGKNVLRWDYLTGAKSHYWLHSARIHWEPEARKLDGLIPAPPEFHWDFEKGLPAGITEQATEIVQAKAWGFVGGAHLRFRIPGVSWVEATFAVPQWALAATAHHNGQWKLKILHLDTKTSNGRYSPVRIALNGQKLWEGSPDGPRIVPADGYPAWMIFEREVSPWVVGGKNVLRWDYLAGAKAHYWLYSADVRWEPDGGKVGGIMPRLPSPLAVD